MMVVRKDMPTCVLEMKKSLSGVYFNPGSIFSVFPTLFL